MTDGHKGTQFDPQQLEDARLAERFLKLAGLFGARYSHYPCVGGLYAVLRLIKDDSQHIPTFSMLGYHPEQERAVRRMLAATGGHRDPLWPHRFRKIHHAEDGFCRLSGTVWLQRYRRDPAPPATSVHNRITTRGAYPRCNSDGRLRIPLRAGSILLSPPCALILTLS